MALTLNLSPEVEELLKARAAGVGQTLEAYLQLLIERDSADVDSPSLIDHPMKSASPEEWIKAFNEWADGFPPINHYVDDSRESVYYGPSQ